MRLLHVASSYPLSANDTTAPFMEEIAVALVAQGHEVMMVVPRRHDLVEGTRNGVTVRGFRYAPKHLQQWGYAQSLKSDGGIRTSAVIVTPLALASMNRMVRRLVRSWRPDVVHLHWLLPQGVLANLLPNTTPVVISLHGADAQLAQRASSWIWLARHALRRADQLVAASTEILQVAQSIEPSAEARSSVIPHGANQDLFIPMDKAQARSHLELDPDRSAILVVARLVEKKGIEHAILALNHLPADTDLYVVGEGPLLQALMTVAGGLRRGRVTFVGSVGRSELPFWYGASDVVVIPSVRYKGDIDSGPVVLTEALASGRPVVATAIGMVPDLIRDGKNGFIVEDANPEALATAIQSALRAGDDLGRLARRAFLEVGDWHRVARDLTAIYEDAGRHRRSVLFRETSRRP